MGAPAQVVSFLALFFFLVGSTGSAPCRANGPEDAAVLVQHLSVRDSDGHSLRSLDGEGPSQTIVETPRGPLVRTAGGEILGASKPHCHLFASIPYAEPPKRFARSLPKSPWGPGPLDASTFQGSCIGSATFTSEREDCLRLHVWAPKGGQRGMPVVVYFHGGLNQHGSGQERIRWGDGIVQSSAHPIIYINFEFRLGIYGWIYGERGSGIPNNLGFTDQQLALLWVQKNIGAFGGDSQRVTLMGQSEGSANILFHLVAPGSRGLFHRCVMVSPPADIWSRNANRDHTLFMARKAGCLGEGMLECLKSMQPRTLWRNDWVSEALSRPVFVEAFLHNVMALAQFTLQDKKAKLDEALADVGWHPVVDNETILGEARELISQGRWHKVPILMTTVMNESQGALPTVPPFSPSKPVEYLLKHGEFFDVRRRYAESFRATGVPTPESSELTHAMFTDKIWMCDIRSLARDFARSGGEVRVGLFRHLAQASVGALTNQVCAGKAVCHSDDMFYLLPQSGPFRVDEKNAKEMAFLHRYSEEFLAFVYGESVSWVPFTDAQEVTLYDSSGPWVVTGYRKQQCDVLDRSMSELLPDFMRAGR